MIYNVTPRVLQGWCILTIANYPLVLEVSCFLSLGSFNIWEKRKMLWHGSLHHCQGTRVHSSECNWWCICFLLWLVVLLEVHKCETLRSCIECTAVSWIDTSHRRILLAPDPFLNNLQLKIFEYLLTSIASGCSMEQHMLDCILFDHYVCSRDKWMRTENVNHI
jgi:hypothetical protein